MHKPGKKAKAKVDCIINGQLLKGILTLLNVLESQNPDENRGAVNINIYLPSDFRAAEQGKLMWL